MADVQPLRTLRYEPAAVGSLEAVIAPPYDVIDDEQRAELAARAVPYNVVEIDLPRANGGDPYVHAHDTLDAWRQQGVVVREDEPALWALQQDYVAPDGSQHDARAASSRACAWRTTAPGASGRTSARIPGPKEDRLRLTRATRANLSPIFSLFPDPDARGAGARSRGPPRDEPFAPPTDADGTANRLWRIGDPSRSPSSRGRWRTRSC